MNLLDLKKDLNTLGNPDQVKPLERFFKTGEGEYGEGDKFLGVSVPDQRKIAKRYQDLSLDDVQKLLDSRIHEHRQVALIILTHQYKRSKDKKKIADLYLKNTKNINNWDLVDISAPKILGDYLLDKDRSVLYKLAKSKNLWEKRIAILSTYAFIKHAQFDDTLNISEILLNDKHDLIHKAVGWMLREVGKKNQAVEERFLRKHYKKMPRTMLRYAIEKFDEKKRKYYMKK